MVPPSASMLSECGESVQNIREFSGWFGLSVNVPPNLPQRSRFLVPAKRRCGWQASDWRKELDVEENNSGTLRLRQEHGKSYESTSRPGNPRFDGKPAFGSIFRATMTDPQGNFRLAPLPASDYHVEPRDVASDLSTERRHAPPLEKHPLPGFFTAQTVTLTAGKESPKLEFRTVPAVLVEGQLVNTKELLDAAAAEQAYAAQIVSRFGSPNFGGAAQWPNRANLGPTAATIRPLRKR